MKTLLEKANTQLEQATRGGADRCDIMYAAGYRQAIIDVARKLKAEGLDELEEEQWHVMKISAKRWQQPQKSVTRLSNAYANGRSFGRILL